MSNLLEMAVEGVLGFALRQVKPLDILQKDLSVLQIWEAVNTVFSLDSKYTLEFESSTLRNAS